MDMLINVDEISLYLKSLFSNYGRGYCSYRIHNLVHYTRFKPKGNVVMAVEPGCNRINGGIDRSVTHP